MKTITKFAYALGGITLMLVISAIIDQPQKANGLKIAYKSLTTVVRYPHAHCYAKGDMILVRVDENMTVTAVVVEPVVLDSELIDDELSADQQPTILTAF